MPLQKLLYGPNSGVRECILGKWKIDPSGISGSYTEDPVEKCFFCNFYDTSNKKHPLQDEKACKCPEWMNWDIYDYLKEVYGRVGDGSIKTFHRLIAELSQKKLTTFDAITKTDLVLLIKNVK
jgi:hypothetical protein